jgi:hypothetical protein
MAKEGNVHPDTEDRVMAGNDGREEPAPTTQSGGQVEESRGRIDQLGSIMSKTLDLVEATVGLGVNLASRLGSVVQEQAVDRFGGGMGSYPEGSPAYGEPGQGAQPPYPEEPERVARGHMRAEVNYVVNPLPLFPGSSVKVSFTINNDSVSVPRQLRLRVEGFVGQMQGATLDGNQFAVEPDSQVVDPMDFEKFTLRGTIAQEAPADNYEGWIIVSEEEEIRIPVRLVVSAPPS